MGNDIRTRPECYSEDGLPIHYNLYREKNGPKLEMSFRLPKDKAKRGDTEFGKILYSEIHKVSSESLSDPLVLQKELEKHAPSFWRHFINSAGCERFISEALNKTDGIPLSIVWDIDCEEIAKQLNWGKETVSRKEKTVKLMEKFGWGNVPIGKLGPKFCGDILLKECSRSEHCAVVALLRQLMDQEIGHKRLVNNPWPKRAAVHRPAPPKQSSTYVNLHIRPDCLVREEVHAIVDNTIPLLSVEEKRKFALALLFCLTMGLTVQELCYCQLSAIKCDSENMPKSLHIKGTIHEKKGKSYRKDYPESSPKNRILPIPTKVALAIKSLLDEWRKKESKESYQTRYLIPHDKYSQRKSNHKELKKWINQHLRKQLQERKIYDGEGNLIRVRAPYYRCLGTSPLSLEYVGFEADELRYFFGLSAVSTAGEFYCDFINSGEQQRLRNLMDQWLGSPLPANMCDSLCQKNPPADTEGVFGAREQIAHVVLTIDIPPVPEELIPEKGYSLHFWARQGLSLDARAQSRSAVA